MKKTSHVIWRGLIYVFGGIFLALGLSLNTKTGLGNSPAVATAYSVATALGVNMSVLLFVLYALMLLLQFVLRGRQRRWRDLLQLPFAFVFSLLMDVYDRYLVLQFPHVWQNLLLMLVAVAFMGAGICMMVNMRLIVNPADGLVQAMSWRAKKELGLMKNLLDVILVALAFLVDVCFTSIWTSVGLGTVITMILAGRAVSLFNRLFREKMLRVAGLSAASEAGGVK